VSVTAGSGFCDLMVRIWVIGDITPWWSIPSVREVS
jgi:hypothetical protein